MSLITGGGSVLADPELVSLARIRAIFEPFEGAQVAPTLSVTRASLPAHAHPLTGVERTYGTFAIAGEHLRISIADDPEAGLAAMRLAWHLSVARAGGFLMHASGAAFGDLGVVATGESSAGKTTLATFLVDAGATLLSDEIVAFFPDGTVRGTPFRSNLELPGSLEPRRLSALLLLAKGAEERVDPVGARELAHALMSQVYVPANAELTRAEALARVTRTVSVARTGRLTFRKDPQAGPFVERWLGAVGR